MLQTINDKIRRAFGESAKSYDRFTDMHRQIADQLFAESSKEANPLRVLDVGCGTGYLTTKFKQYFPQAAITGLDFSLQMLEEARLKNSSITWVLGDGQKLPFADGSFDTVVSNAAYQWMPQLDIAFGEARRVLTPGGILACTLFGFHTCRELFQSLNEAKAAELQFSRLPYESVVREALDAGGLNNFRISTELIKVGFKDMYELMSWLKSIGANNLSHEGFLGPEAMFRAAFIFRQKFPLNDGIGTTFEVIKVYAKK
jgi:malonyl-CoA O-methyltransferase